METHPLFPLCEFTLKTHFLTIAGISFVIKELPWPFQHDKYVHMQLGTFLTWLIFFSYNKLLQFIETDKKLILSWKLSQHYRS